MTNCKICESCYSQLRHQMPLLPECVHDVLLRHVGVPAPLQVGCGHRVGREEEAELSGQDETPDSFENLQTEWWRLLQGLGHYQRSPTGSSTVVKLCGLGESPGELYFFV